MMVVRLSVNRRSLPQPFIHEWVRLIGHRLPAWIGVGHPLTAVWWSKPRISSRSRVVREGKSRSECRVRKLSRPWGSGSPSSSRPFRDSAAAVTAGHVHRCTMPR